MGCGLSGRLGIRARRRRDRDPAPGAPGGRTHGPDALPRLLAIRTLAPEPDFPHGLEPEPLFRYDDHTRGYVDGTVWRLGHVGRPLAYITTELHPKYSGAGPRVVYDYLSLTAIPFSAQSKDCAWTPSGSAVDMQPLTVKLVPAPTPAPGAMVQMKHLAEQFEGTQEVEGQKVQLRLLAKPIDRYRPDDTQADSDGAVFLLCNGRNPAVLLLIETNGESWSWGSGRLSLPSVLTLRLEQDVVWQVEAFAGSNSSQPYCASNSEAQIPGFE